MPPSKLAHLVFQTNRLPAMRDWYCTVLDGHVIYENPHLSFVTYDDEHHRVAFIDFGPLAARCASRRPAEGAERRSVLSLGDLPKSSGWGRDDPVMVAPAPRAI